MTSQGDRRAETRARLLGAAAELLAERGVDGASVAAVAERAERTSGAVYDHFGSKDGLVFALLDGWVDDASVVIDAELVKNTLYGALNLEHAAVWDDPVSQSGGFGLPAPGFALVRSAAGT